jgi:Predicted protease
MNSGDGTKNFSIDLSADSLRRYKKGRRSLFIGVVLACVLFSLLFATFAFSRVTNVSAYRGVVSSGHAGQRGLLLAQIARTSASGGLTPQDLWQMYNLPGINGGNGQLIAEAIDGDVPTLEADLHAYSQKFGLPDCSVASGCLTIQYQGGTRVARGSDPAEGLMDVEIMHAVAPRAKILLYVMKSDVVSIAKGPTEILNTHGLKSINMSYGFGGNGRMYESLYANNPHHVALFAATGDDGSGTLSPPSVYPGVIAVGGTVIDGSTEAAWSGSGGGLSKLYVEPSYQKSYGIPQSNGHRGNPDVAAIAGTPFAIYEMGSWTVETGTSAAAPIWSGIAALVNKPITNALLYSLAKSKPDSFNDITTGTNGNCGFVCTAQYGYDYITGLGTPKDFVANVNAMN